MMKIGFIFECGPDGPDVQVCRHLVHKLDPTIQCAFVKIRGEKWEKEKIRFVDIGIRTSQGARFVDNRRFEGPITEMVDEAETYIMSAMRKSSLIEGMFRRDITEYPRESLRESITNADCRELLQANLHNTLYFLKKWWKRGY
jgi:hypothetical protein